MLEGEEADGLIVVEAEAVQFPLVEADAPSLPSLLEAAGTPGLQVADKPVFSERGTAKIVVMRPCISRGRRIRGLPPIYTPKMLEANAGVFTGWPMYFDHFPPELAEALKRKNRSVREMGGQVLRSWWDPNYVGPDDAKFGYLKGAVLAEAWGTPLLRRTVDNNPHLFHTSINAWPKSARPGTHNGTKGMLIEGIRSEPQGSVDFVPRGGAGGRLLAEEDVRAMVSLAESFYASAVAEKSLAEQLREMDAASLRQYVRQHVPALLPALREEEPAGGNGGGGESAGLTEEDVRRLLAEEREANARLVEQHDERLEERANELIEERETQRHYAGVAQELIEGASGIPASWKADLRARYSMKPDGPSPALLVEEETDDDGKTLTEEQVLRNRVNADLARTRELIAEAQGKPRITGEGGARHETSSRPRSSASATRRPSWRDRAAELRIVESADDALAVHGVTRDDGGDD